MIFSLEIYHFIKYFNKLNSYLKHIKIETFLSKEQDFVIFCNL